ncbi:L,D-transpeptidase [Planosporangium flavigriseum]|uniref:L,D-transpeptidase n=1 Tax=Planosporangium flavigriseum TaxID=373681 RepID=UPI001EF1B9CF|nr:L,D-transpeptidase [Planosporangium flavigriseum]
MRFSYQRPSTGSLRRSTCLAVVALIASTGCAHRPARWVSAQPPAPQPSLAAPSAEVIPSAAAAPADLPVVTYGPAPAGFPSDPDALSTAHLAEGLHPTRKLAAYDAPGGQPRAFLAPTISGVEVTMPVVARKSGWTAVMLPSANRTIAWLPPGDGFTTVPLRDQLVVYRSTHEMRWFRDGALFRSWPVTLGVRQTPTPLGRTFILGRSSLPGAVYANTDVFALGAVPDDVNAVPAGLRGAHIGIHTWHNDRTLGKDDSDGCIRLTKSGQQLLLQELVPGTAVVVLDGPAG